MPVPQIALDWRTDQETPMLAAAMLLILPAQDHVFPGGDDAPPPVPLPRNGEPADVTITGTSPERFRARPMDDRYREKPIRARATLPGGKVADAEAVQRGIAPGISVPSLMFNLRIPLGKKKDDAE
jgi:hypothetical protein